ncbi:MAG: hypothetical protein M0T71_13760 [Actinomycetota bacterium]|nr:hypothetical protein [Actinomycetota bacterium]
MPCWRCRSPAASSGAWRRAGSCPSPVPLAALLPLVTSVDALWQLFGLLAAWGARVGVVDVGMNTEAATVQARLGRRVLSGLHASYSAGGLVGAPTGAACASLGVSVRDQLAAVSAAVPVAAPAVAIAALAGVLAPGADRLDRATRPSGVAATLE